MSSGNDWNQTPRPAHYRSNFVHKIQETESINKENTKIKSQVGLTFQSVIYLRSAERSILCVKFCLFVLYTAVV